ncbi:MAG: MFS transporter [Leptospiraceae bacterium]|nr:MFS transporter [Leptospiraceae bacterium]
MLKSIPYTVYFLTISHMLIAFGYTMSYVFIPVYLFEVKHLSAGIVGSITGLATFFGLLGWLPASFLTQKMGEKLLMIVSFTIRSLNFFFLGWIIYFDLPYLSLIPFLLLNTFLMGISISPLESYILNITTKDNRNIAVSIHRTGMNIGWAFGPFVGGILAHINYALPFFGTFALTLFAVFLIQLTISSNFRNSKSYKISYKSFKTFFTQKKFLLFSLNSLNLFILMSLLITPLSVFLTSHFQISKMDLGKLYLLNGLMVSFLQIPFSLWIKDLYFSVQAGLFLYFVGYFSVGFFSEFHHLELIFLSMVIITIGEILSVSAVYTLASFFAKENSELDDGTINSYVSSFIGFIRSLGWSIGPIIAGWIQDFVQSPLMVWFLSSVFGIVGLIFYAIIFRLKD